MVSSGELKPLDVINSLGHWTIRTILRHVLKLLDSMNNSVLGIT